MGKYFYTFLFALAALIGLTILFSAAANSEETKDTCVNEYFEGEPYTICLFAEPVCFPSSILPPPSEFARQKEMELVFQLPVQLTDPDRQGILNFFRSPKSGKFEYWLFYLDTQEVCMVMEANPTY